MWTKYLCIIWEFKFANLCQGYHASLLTTTWGRTGKTKIATKTSDASSPHRLLTPSSCSQLNSGQTSRLVSCGVTFGSQYTHLIRPSSFFQRTLRQDFPRHCSSWLCWIWADFCGFWWWYRSQDFLLVSMYNISCLWFCMSSANKRTRCPFNPFLIHHLILPPSVRWIYEGLRVSDWTLPVAPQPAADARDSDDREAVTSYHSLVLAVFLCRLILSLFKFSRYISWMVIPLNKRSFCSHFLGFSTHNPCSKVSDTCYSWNGGGATRTRPALVNWIDNLS